MHSSPNVLSVSAALAEDRAPRAHRVEDMVYQVVTVGAILLVLGTVWIF